jgi:hypothetical protein
LRLGGTDPSAANAGVTITAPAAIRGKVQRSIFGSESNEAQNASFRLREG